VVKHVRASGIVNRAVTGDQAVITAQKACNQISAFIMSRGGRYSEWYCGVAADWEDRLFNRHRLGDKSYRWWMVAEACLDNAAATLARDALRYMGCDGGPAGDGEEDAVHVYAYLKGSSTRPKLQ
jgi:hypothetical protein